MTTQEKQQKTIRVSLTPEDWRKLRILAAACEESQGQLIGRAAARYIASGYEPLIARTEAGEQQ